MTTYTPGPWTINPDNNGYTKALACIIGCDGQRVCDFGIAQPYYPTEGTEPTAADMRLMLVTPELLEALQNLLDAHAIPSSTCKERPAYEAAQTVIAKVARYG